MAARYTKLQGEYLDFIDRYTRRHGRPPSEADLMAYFNVMSSTVHQMVVRLEKCGLVERTPGEARSIRILAPREELPLANAESHTTPIRAPLNTHYPDLAGWVMGTGWVVLGKTLRGDSMGTAMNESGVVWEGKEGYKNFEELLQDLEKGIRKWKDENL